MRTSRWQSWHLPRLFPVLFYAGARALACLSREAFHHLFCVNLRRHGKQKVLHRVLALTSRFASPPLPLLYIGWVGVSSHRHRGKHAAHHVSTATRLPLCFNLVFPSFLGDRPQLVIGLHHLCKVINLYSAQENASYHIARVYGKAPKRQSHSTSIAVSKRGHTGNY